MNHTATPPIAASLREEHEELHRDLTGVTRMSGDVGKAARKVAKLLHRHFLSEEQWAMPPLGVLARIAQGELPPEAEDIIRRVKRLQEELPKMLEEHRQITAALEELQSAAVSDRQIDAIAFAHRLRLHAENEEEVLYPAAILVGKYLELVTGSRRS
jgi:hypothetical protein